MNDLPWGIFDKYHNIDLWFEHSILNSTFTLSTPENYLRTKGEKRNKQKTFKKNR